MNILRLSLLVILILKESALAVNSSSVTVASRVMTSCSTYVGSIKFNKYKGSENRTESAVYVQCTKGTNFTIGIEDGGSCPTNPSFLLSLSDSGDDESDDKKSSDEIVYGVYSDIASTNMLNSCNKIEGVSTGLEQEIPIYALIPSGQNNIPNGTYSAGLPITFTVVDKNTKSPTYRALLTVSVSVEKSD